MVITHFIIKSQLLKMTYMHIYQTLGQDQDTQHATKVFRPFLDKTKIANYPSKSVFIYNWLLAIYLPS